MWNDVVSIFYCNSTFFLSVAVQMFVFDRCNNPQPSIIIRNFVMSVGVKIRTWQCKCRIICLSHY